MAAYLNDAIAEVVALLPSVWPDIVAADGGKRVWEVEHIGIVPFEQVTLPAAVVVVESQPWQEGPITRSYVQLDVAAYYVAENVGRPIGIRTKLEALRDVLYPTSLLAQSQVMDDPLPHAEWSMRLDINRLLRGKKVPALGGRVTFRAVAGED